MKHWLEDAKVVAESEKLADLQRQFKAASDAVDNPQADLEDELTCEAKQLIGDGTAAGARQAHKELQRRVQVLRKAIEIQKQTVREVTEHAQRAYARRLAPEYRKCLQELAEATADFLDKYSQAEELRTRAGMEPIRLSGKEHTGFTHLHPALLSIITQYGGRVAAMAGGERGAEV